MEEIMLEKWDGCLDRENSVPSGNLLHSYGKSPFLMGKSTISMAIFNSKLLVYQRVTDFFLWQR